jgi:hypothetical protein
MVALPRRPWHTGSRAESADLRGATELGKPKAARPESAPPATWGSLGRRNTALQTATVTASRRAGHPAGPTLAGRSLIASFIAVHGARA